MSDVMFEQSSSRTEVTLRYSVDGAPFLTTGLDKKKAKPVSVNFVFLDGEFYDLKVFAQRIKVNGELTQTPSLVADVYSYDSNSWPAWLADLRDLAFKDFRNGYRVDV